ncbi:MAG: hypothetical protein JO112_05670, partial [Planctomycetes bacterium]|nr:hypothetical protein [Planctomycetota bacterium]
MVRTNAGVSACGLLAILWGIGPAWGAAPTQDLTRRQGQQKQVRETTDHLVRRVSTMLRVLDYYQLDRTAQGKLLDEVASTLSGLSKEQMQEVLARLEAAAKAPDGARQGKEMDAAYARHREILEQLRKLLARYEAVRNLDQAADQLEKSSRDQLELYVKTTQLAQFLQDPGQRNEDKAARRMEVPVLGDEQRDLHHDVGDLFRKLDTLREQLPPDQQARLANMEAAARKLEVLTKLERAANQLPRQA